jgi:hypothetical protein
MSLRTRVLAALAVVGGIGVVVACGSDAGESDFGSSSGASGSSGSTGGSSSGGFGSSGTTSSSSGASGVDANPANCKAPIDMYIMFDRSGSMKQVGTDCNIGGTGTSKWCRSINALAGYLNSPGAKDHAAALQFFSRPGHQDNDCDTGNGYNVARIPATGYEVLPTTSFNKTLDDEDPGGDTPTEAAIRGITGFTAANRRPGRVTIGILITDGDPNGCNEDLDDLAALLQAHNTATKVRTYVIGMAGASFGKLEKIAKGGGAPPHPATVGTLTNACGNQPEPCTFWNVGDGEPAAFEAALAAIQQQADGCNPDGGGFINPVN